MVELKSKNDAVKFTKKFTKVDLANMGILKESELFLKSMEIGIDPSCFFNTQMNGSRKQPSQFRQCISNVQNIKYQYDV